MASMGIPHGLAGSEKSLTPPAPIEGLWPKRVSTALHGWIGMYRLPTGLLVPRWVRLNNRPAMLTLLYVVLGSVDLGNVNETVPFPLPDLGFIAICEKLLLAVHAHPDGALMFTETDPPAGSRTPA